MIVSNTGRVRTRLPGDLRKVGRAVPTTDLSRVALEAMRLQNGYAYAVDTRDWDLFQTLFPSDVVAHYPHETFTGMKSWLANFIPFHDECPWTLHVMTNHVVGEDAAGTWAACYGSVQWVHQDNPDKINRSSVLYRDRLRCDEGLWRVERRKLDLLMHELDAPIPAGVELVQSVLDLADVSYA